jgi:L-asparagine transporter-like permease|tara:strand:- start:159 stop:461 length:303 start_codon:yes stop_codon:yes gene_type:complete
MKWLYVGMGILGAISPTAIFYIMHLDRTVPGSIIDVGVLFYGAAVSIIVIPPGIVVGILLAGAIHLVINKITSSRRPIPPSISDFRHYGNRRQGDGLAGR